MVPVTLGLPNLYRSSASLLVNQLPETFSESGGAWELDGRLQAIKQEALSRTRLTYLIEQFDLYPKLRARSAIAGGVDRLQKDVKVEITSTTERNGRVTTVGFKVTYVGTDPVKVADVANWLALFYVATNDAMRSGRVSRATEFLKQELDSTKVRLDQQEQEVIDFTTRNVGALPQQMNSTLAKYGQATQQLQLNTAEQLRLMDRRDAVQNDIASLSTTVPSADVTDPNLKLAQAQKELDALRLRFADGMPEIRDKKREIAALQSAVTARDAHDGQMPGPSRLATLQSQLTSINARLDQLRKSNDEAKEAIRVYDVLIERAPMRDTQFEKISRDVRSTRELYASLQKRYQDALLAERAEQGSGGEEFHILDPAVPASGPAAPNRPLLLGGSVVLALALGIGLVFLLQWLDTSFSSVDELRAFTHVPVLATIPVIVTRRDRMRRFLTSCAIGAVALVALAVASAGVFQVAQRAEQITRMLLRG